MPASSRRVSLADFITHIARFPSAFSRAVHFPTHVDLTFYVRRGSGEQKIGLIDTVNHTGKARGYAQPDMHGDENVAYRIYE